MDTEEKADRSKRSPDKVDPSGFVGKCWSITHSKQRLYKLHKYNTPCKIANSKLQVNK